MSQIICSLRLTLPVLHACDAAILLGYFALAILVMHGTNVANINGNIEGTAHGVVAQW